MAKKPLTTVTIKTTKVGPRKIVEMIGLTIGKIKFERTVCSFGWHDKVGMMPSVEGKKLPEMLVKLENGEMDYLIYTRLNPDYHTFTVTRFERITI